MQDCNSNLKHFNHINLIPTKLDISNAQNISAHHDEFSLVHMNIRSLPQNFNKLDDFISIFKSFNVLAMSETWVTAKTNLSRYQMNNYSLITSSTSGRGRGSALYVSHQNPYKIREDISSDSNVCDCICIELIQPQPLIIIAIYRSPSSRLSQFLTELKFILHKAFLTGHKIMVCGDINIDLCKLNCSNEYIETLCEYELQNLIVFPTRQTSKSSSLIDHIFTNIPNKFFKSGVINYDISDHLPVFTTFANLTFHTSLPVNTYVYDFKKYNKNRFRTDTKKIQWETDQKSANNMFNNFVHKFGNLCKQHLPKKTIKRKKQQRKPYITTGILNSIKQKHKLFRKMNSDPRNLNLRQNFITYRNLLNAIVVRAKTNYYHSSFLDNKNNAKKTWKLINELTRHKSYCKSAPKLIELDNETINNPLRIANEFNSFFSSIGKSLQKDFPRTTEDVTKHINQNLDSMFLIPCTYQEISDMLKSINVHKAIGIDDEIHPQLLKDTHDLIALPLTSIFNEVLKTGIFPDRLKVAKVTPIHKRGDPSKITNYRPISVLPTLSKILEKLLLQRLTSFFTKHNLLSRYQFAFQK
ncbi:Uncharacterised protein at_DN0802, partial [Pycnogonum litorale]